MHNLKTLIEKYGKPDALIDHWDNTSSRYVIWGFDESFSINYKGEAIINDVIYSNPPLELLQTTLEKWKGESETLSAIGYISYDFKNILYPHISFKQSIVNEPLLWFGKPKTIIPYNLTKDNDNIDNPLLKLKKDIPLPNEYKKYIKDIKKSLGYGDSYQINFTQPKIYELNKDPFDIYFSMRNKVNPHYGMFLKTDENQILSFSPERFFKTSNNKIESYPMKGTRPRSNNIIIDKQLASELSSSIKDKAEHLMIVDLIRNDLGKICKYGSIKVDNLYNIHSYKTVHQMISCVYGELLNNLSEIEIIKALFPGGSITGAPKEKSMKIIDSLENYQRGIYTGSIGFIKANGEMDFNIAIRTMTVKNNIGIYPVGGGIVWDSDSLEEWQEAHQKGAILKQFCNKNSYIMKNKKQKVKDIL